MNRLSLTVIAATVATSLGAVAAVAANIAPPAPGTVVYGAVVGTPPAGAVPPEAPPGFQYQWVYAYDHHGYHGHWEAIRIGS